MTDEPVLSMREVMANHLAVARRGLRYWRRGAALFLVVLAAGVGYVAQKPRAFRAEAVFEVVPATGAATAEARPAEEVKAEVESMVGEVFGLAPNQDRVVRELGLYPGMSQAFHRRRELATNIAWRVDAPRRVTLSFRHRDPETARRVVDRLLALYQEKRREAQTAGARRELAVVDRQLAEVERELATRDAHRARYYEANRAFMERIERLRSGGIVPVGAPPPADAESARTRRLRAQVAALEADARRLQAPPGAAATADSDAARALREQLRESDARLRALRAQYTDAAPAVAQERARRERVQAQLDAETARLARAAASDRALSAGDRAARLAAVRARLDAARRDLAASAHDDARGPALPAPTAPADASLARASFEQVRLEWDALAQERRTTLEQLARHQTRRHQLDADLAAADAPPLRVLLAPRTPEEPEPPGKRRMAALVAALATVLGSAVALVSGFLDTRVYEPADVARWGEIPGLAEIPELHAGGEGGAPPGGA